MSEKSNPGDWAHDRFFSVTMLFLLLSLYNQREVIHFANLQTQTNQSWQGHVVLRQIHKWMNKKRKEQPNGKILHCTKFLLTNIQFLRRVFLWCHRGHWHHNNSSAGLVIIQWNIYLYSTFHAIKCSKKCFTVKNQCRQPSKHKTGTSSHTHVNMHAPLVTNPQPFW